MDATELEETLRVFEASLSEIKWRLKPTSKCRLQTDILALCTGMRPVIMVDYGGKMPELGDRLCAFLKSCKKNWWFDDFVESMPYLTDSVLEKHFKYLYEASTSSYFKLLQVMVIDDMVYLIQVKALANFVTSSLNLEFGLLFVDLEDDLPKVRTLTEKSPALIQLIAAQQLFSTVFLESGISCDHLLSNETLNVGSSLDGHVTSVSSELVDLSCCLQKCQVTIPTLNGWLLGYPIVYLFGTDFIEHAICSLSTTSLRIYQIFVNRVGASMKGSAQEELMSFTVPYDLSLEGSNEPWAKLFLAQMQEKLNKCKHVWGSLHMEVSDCYPQAIAL